MAKAGFSSGGLITNSASCTLLGSKEISMRWSCSRFTLKLAGTYPTNDTRMESVA